MSISLTDLKEYDSHKYVGCFYDSETKTRSVISLHRGGVVNPCFGATRFWEYGNLEEAINDSLRLARMMSYKNALAGTKYGGAKAVIISDAKRGKRKENILKHYAEFVNMLGGTFITGADVGVTEDDVDVMKSTSDYIVGVKHDPVYYTVQGLYFALQAASKEVFGTDDLEGRTFAIQGLGKTGGALLELIYDKAEKIYVADVESAKVNKYSHLKKVKIVSKNVIHTQKVDIFCPCALHGVLNEDTVHRLQCSIILGSANNQLSTPEVGEQIYQMGTLYAPDYVVNAGGLISVVDEYEHPRASKTRVLERVRGIKGRLTKIIRNSRKKGRSTSREADIMAEKIITSYR